MLFGASAINVLWGPVNFGQVVTGKSNKSQYNPTQSKCYFVIPSDKLLQQIDTGFEKINPLCSSKYYLQL